MAIDEKQQQTDHDLLIGLSTNIKQILECVSCYERRFVTKDEFKPVQKTVYGLVGLVLASSLGLLFKHTLIGN